MQAFIPIDNPQRILVIKLGAFGDFIQALGPMRAIRDHHPSARITLLTTAPFAAFGKSCGYFDEIWVDGRPRLFDLGGWLGLRRKLNGGAFDRVYDLQNNDRTALYLRLFGKKPQWVGAAYGASHRNASPERTAGHAFDGHVQTLRLAGITNVAVDRLEWMEADLGEWALGRSFVLLVPGSAPNRPEKRWPAAHYGALAVLLARRGYKPIVIGTKSETAAAAVILRACPEALDLTGKTQFDHIAALARRAEAAIGNDTGPMHLIAATGCPSLVLFSRHSNPMRHAPRGENVSVLFRDDLASLDAGEVMAAVSFRSAAGDRPTIFH